MNSLVKRTVSRVFGQDFFLTLSAIRQIRGGYEPAYREFLNLIPEGGTLLDIGANIGISCAVASRVRPDVSLVAFEPLFQNVRILMRIKRLYRFNLQLMPVALGDTEGSVSFAVPEVGGVPATGLSHIVSDEYKNPDVEQHPFSTVKVGITTLDSMCVRLPKVDAIKIDVEDHEFHVLNGGKNLLMKHRPIVFCELWDTPNRPKALALMQSLGYSVEQKGDIDFLFTA